MKQVFGTAHTSPKAHNVMLDAATRLRDRPLAQMVTKALFGDLLAEPQSKALANDAPNKTSNTEILPAPHTSLVIDHSDARLNPEANERSLTALIIHLSINGRFEELQSLVNDLIPFLSTSSVDNRDPETGDKVKPNDLPLSLYPVIIEGIGKAGKTGLAQRIYNLALQAEADAMTKYMQLSNATRHHSLRPCLPIELYTSMLNIWSNESRTGRRGRQWVKGWRVPGDSGVIRRETGASEAAWQTYLVAQRRWRQASRQGRHEQFKPNVAFYRALVRACENRWSLDSTEWRSQGARQELEEVVNEMRAYDIPMPANIARKLGLASEDRPLASTSMTREKDPAVNLAGMILDAGADSGAEQHRRIFQSD